MDMDHCESGVRGRYEIKFAKLNLPPLVVNSDRSTLELYPSQRDNSRAMRYPQRLLGRCVEWDSGGEHRCHEVRGE